MTDLDLMRLATSRRTAMEGIFVETPRTKEAHSKFHELIEHAATTTRNKMCVLMVAPPQSGKTKVIETFVQKMNRPELLALREVPVLHVSLYAQVTRKGLAQDILASIGDYGFETGSSKGSEQDLWKRVFRYLEAAKVKLLVLDEVQHVRAASEAMAHSVGDTIKGALNNGPCPIVLSGIATAELPFRVNRQLQQRSIPSIELRRLRADVTYDVKLFGEFLAAYIVNMKQLGVIEDASILLSSSVASCILEVSRGVLGAACRLLMEAVVRMTLDGRSSLIAEDLSLATEEAFRRSKLHDRNPFVSGLGGLRDYDAEEARAS